MDAGLIGSIVGIGVLVLLSAFFASAETALTAVSRARIHHLAEQGDRRARIVARLISQRERLIGTLLIGNNAVNILASSLATSVLIALVGDVGVALATAGMIVVVVIFAEVVPKTYAIRHADSVSLILAPIVSAVVTALSPLANAIHWIASSLLRLFGSGRAIERSEAAEEELRGAISLHAMTGSTVRPAHDMLHSILDLDDLTVADAMTHRKSVIMFDADLPPDELLAKILSSRFSRVPLWRTQPENIVGVLNVKDLLRALVAVDNDPSRLQWEAIADRPWFIPESTTLFEQLNAFRDRHRHLALVVDEYGSFMGLITLEDILEEIVGDIVDEHDAATRLVTAQADGSYLVLGTAPIRDLNRRLGWDLSDEHATTVAGYLLHHAQTLPEVGQAFMIGDYVFEVRARRANQITQVRIVPHTPIEPDEA